MNNRKSFYAVSLALILLAVLIVVKAVVLLKYFSTPATTWAIDVFAPEVYTTDALEPSSTADQSDISKIESRVESVLVPETNEPTPVESKQITPLSNPSKPELELKGTVIAPPQNSWAVITDTATGKTDTYKVGDIVRGGWIVSIEKDGVVIDLNGQAIELESKILNSYCTTTINGVLAPDADEPDYSVPDWIETEGIRAGFMSSTAGNLATIPRYINAANIMGLNTAIIYGCSFAETSNHLTNYREWLRLCNQAGFHVFAFYPWQPPVGNQCRPVVFSDGTKGLFPCPLDDKLWQDYLTTDMAVKLAGLSVEGPLSSFDGYFLDMEMYRTEDQANNKKDYSYDTCYCNTCFSSFITNRTHLKNVPTVRKNRRKTWLTNNGYLPDYHAYLEVEVEKKAEALKNSVHAINPKLLFGVYPALNDTNWVRNSVMRALGRDSYPVISFTTDTYGYFGNRAFPSTWGAERIPSDLDAYFGKYDINGIYVSGYLFRIYNSTEIKEHLIKSSQCTQGYWLFRLPQLVDSDIPEFERLAGGTQADYIQAIKDANSHIRKP